MLHLAVGPPLRVCFGETAQTHKIIPEMKATPAITRSGKGMTLLELTVVILVLLGLVAILFSGATAWKRGSDRSGCVLNIRNAQNAVRAYQNVRVVSEGAPLDMATDILGPGKFLEIIPRCPSGGVYAFLDHVPSLGELAMPCSLSTSDAHVPASYAEW